MPLQAYSSSLNGLQQKSQLPAGSRPGSPSLSGRRISCQRQARQAPAPAAGLAGRAPAVAAAAGRQSRRGALSCSAMNNPGGPGPAKPSSELGFKFNPVYLAIIGAYAALLVFRNPFIYAVLTVATVLPQNSNVTSLNNLVLIFYESGLFMNFAEAVTCVRLVTWLSMGFMVGSFALFT